MLLFEAYRKGKPLEGIDLSGCYIYGHDSIPQSADIIADNNRICCNTSTSVACALVIPWYAGSTGAYILNTNRLPERNRPYNLNLELARGQMARIYRKREDWTLFDHPEAADINEVFTELRDELVEALITDTTDPGAASIQADDILDRALMLGERLTLLHAEVIRNRRLQNEGAILLGSRTNIEIPPDKHRPQVLNMFEFINIPTPWKQMEPTERNYRYGDVDNWISWAQRHNKQIFAGPLLNLDKENLPDWIPLWKDDYETMRILLLTHVQRLLEKYGDVVDYWTVISGLSVNNFDLEFDQITELTRTACQIVKKLSPRSQALIEIPMPWGEYYSRNQRSIPPLLYADIAYQNNMKFDGFAIPLRMGEASDGYYVRDIMQISEMLEEFLPHAKDVHLTLCQVPSAAKRHPDEAGGGKKPIIHAGMWHKPWSEKLQAEWLRVIARMALSKPFIKSICWGDLVDRKGMNIYHGGLLRTNMAPKESMKEFANLRNTLNVIQEPESAPAAEEHPAAPPEQQQEE